MKSVIIRYLGIALLLLAGTTPAAQTERPPLVTLARHPLKPVRLLTKALEQGTKVVTAPFRVVESLFVKRPTVSSILPDDVQKIADRAHALVGIPDEDRALIRTAPLKGNALASYHDGVITIDLKRFVAHTYGVQLLTLVHENFHHKFDDTDGIDALCEHRADKHTLKVARCWRCVTEFAHGARAHDQEERGYASHQDCLDKAAEYRAVGLCCDIHAQA